MSSQPLSRRLFLKTGVTLLALGPLMSCAPAAPTPTPAPTRPAETPKPAPTPSPATPTPAPTTPTVAPTPTLTVAPKSLAGQELVLYSARKEDLMAPLLQAFQSQTGIRVILKSGAPGELALLIEQERQNPQGDVYFTTDAGTAETLREKGLLEPYQAPGARAIPDEFKAPDSSWVGVIGRVRTIIYNTNLVKEAETPRSVFDLTDPTWKNRVALAAIREGGVRLWLASLMVLKGEEFTTKYIKDLLANGARVLADHTQVRKAVGRGEFALGLVNHYYYVFEKREGSPVGLIYPDQGPNDVGTLVMPLAVAIIKGARHPEAARAFIDFTLSPAGQKPLMEQENEISLIPGISLPNKVAGVKELGEFKRSPVTVADLAKVLPKVVQIFTPLLSSA